MIPKKKGLVNQTIYDYTIYKNEKYCFYPTISDMQFLINKIIEVNETTEYIRITPFYVNCKLDAQIEFENFMFYIECRDSLNNVDYKAYLSECMDRDYDVPHIIRKYEDLSDEEKRFAQIMYPLCQKDNTKGFHKALIIYKDYLMEFVPTMFEIVKEYVMPDDYPFGYFCFEIHSS